MLRTMLATVIAAGTCALATNAHARAPKYPEYQKIWEDGVLRTNMPKGLKGKTRSQTSGLPTGKRQHKPFTVTKPIDK